MTAMYWKMVGENIAKGLGEKTVRRFSTGSKFLGRAGVAVGVGLVAYELFSNYKKNIENEPAYQEMVILQEEMEKWGNTISCLGRESFEKKAFGSFDEGGAINALFPKKLIQAKGIKDSDPEEAATLIQRAIDYLQSTRNLLANDEFDKKRDDLVSRLASTKKKLISSDNYEPIQKELADIVMEIQPIESGYSARIYDCSQEIQKSLGSNAAWAAFSAVTFGLVKKPKK